MLSPCWPIETFCETALLKATGQTNTQGGCNGVENNVDPLKKKKITNRLTLCIYMIKTQKKKTGLCPLFS